MVKREDLISKIKSEKTKEAVQAWRLWVVNSFAVIALVLGCCKCGWSPFSLLPDFPYLQPYQQRFNEWLVRYASSQGWSDCVGFVGFGIFTFITTGEMVMYVYDWMCHRREYKAEKLRQEGRQEGRREGRQEREEELRQGIAQVFADDKDAMEKLDKFFNGHNG